MGTGFDDRPVLTGPTLELRPLTAEDRDDLTVAAADEATWAGHPAKERYKAEVFGPYFDFLLKAGGTLIIRERTTGRAIGCSRYYTVPDQPDGIGVGFTFLNSVWWGGATNFELKRLMLDYAFKSLPTVWFHIAPCNIRSQKATAKLGAVEAYEATLDLAGSPAVWKCFRLDRDVWERIKSARAV
jgi:N-acetyltransferase